MIFKSFVDSNLFIYALLEGEADPSKKEKAKTFLEELKSKSQIIVSVQVINEFHWVLKRKYQIEETIIRQKVSNDILGLCDVIPLDMKTYKYAYKIRDRYDVSFWDSLLVASALNNECDILYSEDMQHNLEIEEKLLIRDPLTGAISNETEEKPSNDRMRREEGSEVTS